MSYWRGILINEWIKRKKRVVVILITYTVFVFALLITEWNMRDASAPAVHNDDWRPQLELKIKQLETQIQLLDSEDTVRKQLNGQLAIAGYQLQANIPPEPKGAVHWINSDTGGMLIKYIIPLIIIIIGADLFTAEGSAGTIKHLLLSPMGRTRLFWGKLLFLIVLSSSVLLFIHTLSFTIGLLKDGRLGFMDPYAVLNQAGIPVTMQSWKLAIAGIGLNLLSVATVSSIVLGVSLLLSASSSFAVLMSFIIVMILDSFLTMLRSYTAIIDYYPILHLDLVSHLYGAFTGSINLAGSCQILIATILLCTAGGWLQMKHKDFIS
ncbi:ABC transporter permease subunit [Paenibacillus sp. FSL R7-0331]|uniref:ABC transporter permease subunit n=1 Tax=Paenibacillus sp. FSL R7-0331 TaxID=1536773 RepID=UPI0004F8C081|nr:ABC transporter permease subunit [Paenibacillus sp. FSL R7-0331]AIQ55454.1 hypothetical protein R70331_30905 [Paenibacillus sp. FSL R7-0331]